MMQGFIQPGKKLVAYALKIVVFSWLLLVCSWQIGLCQTKNKIEIIYDSLTKKENLQPGWGFAAIITVADKKIMIDTGWEADRLAHNLKKFGYTPDDIDFLMISHWHPDHTGGLRYLLAANPGIITYVPDAIPDYYEGLWPLKTIKNYQEIVPHIYLFQTTPKNKRYQVKKELTLVLDSTAGPVLVSGCFHSGWPTLLHTIKPVLGKKPYLMLGGGRFIDLNKQELTALAGKLRTLGLQNVGLSHCAAGVLPEAVFKQFYQNHIYYARLGSVFDLPGLPKD